MALDLLGQMNVLKGLTDESLQGELSRPSGEAPPFLVLSEINRRKDMRQRFSADTARHAPQTTVAQDIAGAPPPAPAMPEPAPPSGIAAAGVPPAGPGFAGGGLVDYNNLASTLENQLTMTDAQKKQALWMALLQGGAATMSAGNSNTLQNLGVGIGAGLNSYTDAIKTQDSRAADAQRALISLGQTQHSDALAQIQADQENRRIAIAQQQADTQAAIDHDPANVRETRAYMAMTPEEKAAYDHLHPAYNPNQLTQDQQLGGKLDAIYQDSQKKFPIDKYLDTDPEAIAAKLQKAQADAYDRIKAVYHSAVADEWARGMGINPNDLLLAGGVGTSQPAAGGTTAPAVNPKDPLGLGF